MENLTKLEQLTKALTDKGIRFEVNQYGRFDDKTQIGINTNDCIWVWFDYIPTIDYFFFNQQYSQRTGSVTKSVRKGLLVQRALNKKLKQQIF